jgi:hypothetical protein
MGSTVEARDDCGREERGDSLRGGRVVEVCDFCFDVVAEVVDIVEPRAFKAAFSV